MNRPNSTSEMRSIGSSTRELPLSATSSVMSVVLASVGWASATRQWMVGLQAFTC
jgi:hypothetical protein